MNISENTKVYNIDRRNKAVFDAKVSKHDFKYSFEKEANPEIILQDNISLYMLDENEAVFVDCGSENIFDSKYAFAYDAQFQNAKKLITMSLESFFEISKTIPVPNIPVIHAPNHSRCGSTLLAKVFAAIPSCLSVSEWYSLSNVTEMSRIGQFDEYRLKKIVRCCVLNIMKHANLRNCHLVFMKHQNKVTYITNLMMDVFPQFKHVYMYRQPIPFLRSWEKISVRLGSTFEVCTIMRMCGMGKHKLMKKLPSYSPEKIKTFHVFHKISLLWITGVGAFQSLVEQGYDIRSLKYEHLIENPLLAMESLFEYANFPLSKMPDLAEVFAKDSQSGNILSNRNVGDVKEEKSALTSLSAEINTDVNTICDDFNVPRFWEDVLLCKGIGKN